MLYVVAQYNILVKVAIYAQCEEVESAVAVKCFK